MGCLTNVVLNVFECGQLATMCVRLGASAPVHADFVDGVSFSKW